MSDLDEIDLALLRALSQDASQSAGALGRELGLSQPATWRRIKRLQDLKILVGRQLDLDLLAEQALQGRGQAHSPRAQAIHIL